MPKSSSIIKYDIDGDPVVCMNKKYIGGKILSHYQRCEGCEFEKYDLFTGTSGKQVWCWYCDFLPEV